MLSILVIPFVIRNETLKNGKKPNFGLNLWPVWPKFGVSSLTPEFTYTSSEEMFQAVIQCNLKEN